MAKDESRLAKGVEKRLDALTGSARETPIALYLAPDATLQTCIDDFLRYCVEYSMPVFVPCTPVDFQTHRQEGGNAHPKYWGPTLARHPDLRLCFGHAGGGRAKKEQHAGFGRLGRKDRNRMEERQPCADCRKALRAPSTHP